MVPWPIVHCTTHTVTQQTQIHTQLHKQTQIHSTLNQILCSVTQNQNKRNTMYNVQCLGLYFDNANLYVRATGIWISVCDSFTLYRVSPAWGRAWKGSDRSNLWTRAWVLLVHMWYICASNHVKVPPDNEHIHSLGCNITTNIYKQMCYEDITILTSNQRNLVNLLL